MSIFKSGPSFPLKAFVQTIYHVTNDYLRYSDSFGTFVRKNKSLYALKSQNAPFFFHQQAPLTS